MSEVLTLSTLFSWTLKMQEARREAEKEKERIKGLTLGADEYCARYRMSQPTLIKRRNMGLIPFVMLGSEYRYLIPVENGGYNG